MRITTIRVAEETREKLKELGKKGETYDKIIKELIKKAFPSKTRKKKSPLERL